MQAIVAISAKPEPGSASVVQNGAKKNKTTSFASLLDSLKTPVASDKKPNPAAMQLNEAPVAARGSETRQQGPQLLARNASQDKAGEPKKPTGKSDAESVPTAQGAKIASVAVPVVHAASLNKSQNSSESTEKIADSPESSTTSSKNAKKKLLGSSSLSESESAGAHLLAMAAGAQDKTNASSRRVDSKDSADGMKLSTEKNASGARFSVVDMRLKAAKGGGKGSSEDKQDTSGKQNPETSLQSAALDSRDTRAEFGRSTEGSGGKQATLETKTLSFADQLASRIRESGGSDIVKAAHIVLRDGDSGMIRLRLDPESLGGVKIELKIADKKLSGVIVVESDMAGQAFKDSLQSLRDAFSASGFETQSLEVEVRNGNSGGRESGQGGKEEANPYFSRRLKELDAAVPQVRSSASRDGLLNVVI